MKNSGPLSGVKVVEFGGIGPGPFAGMLFADMGADVIVIERKSSSSSADQAASSAAMFLNRGKRSIALNMKSAEGVQLALRLVDSADVLIEGFRPGVMERLGVGPDVCLARNPKLIFGRMTGWGQTGPLAQAAGHDPNYIGISGALWYGGRPGHAPTAPLTSVGDIGGGAMVLCWGVLCALMQARESGVGQVVDAAITDGSAYTSSLLLLMRNTGQLAENLGQGWADGAAPWNETYQCADGGFITICALEPKFYQELLQRLDLTEHRAFRSQWDTSAWGEGKGILSSLFNTQSRDHWCELLEGTDACFSPILSFEEAERHPHNIARGTYIRVNDVLQPSIAPKMSNYQAVVGAPPLVGQDGGAILTELGLGAGAIDSLRNQGVI
ncbi:CaiB/BaiF CoA transferase family protein [Zhongshania aliphaticivorans]|uniref:CoA-transferase n=1 Tax=Zhongshania aliphaticivorans TaxID=1470434 RepID=A0A127M218_9GAMM|nr:CaiB/BaiF CoA-transferase family protein [Zhongshania aliphaticivorans]AMO67264.1 CoA-transferase [Zhongshania aliphaticivorans]